MTYTITLETFNGSTISGTLRGTLTPSKSN